MILFISLMPGIKSHSFLHQRMRFLPGHTHCVLCLWHRIAMLEGGMLCASAVFTSHCLRGMPSCKLLKVYAQLMTAQQPITILFTLLENCFTFLATAVSRVLCHV